MNSFNAIQCSFLKDVNKITRLDFFYCHRKYLRMTIIFLSVMPIRLVIRNVLKKLKELKHLV